MQCDGFSRTGHAGDQHEFQVHDEVSGVFLPSISRACASEVCETRSPPSMRAISRARVSSSRTETPLSVRMPSWLLALV
jgi:hypothetical protein